MLRGEHAIWAAALAACGVCCAGPVVAILAAIGLTSAMAAIAVPALAAVALAAAVALWWLRRRGRRGRAPAGEVLLPSPTLRTRDELDVG